MMCFAIRTLSLLLSPVEVNTNKIIDNKILFLWFYFFKSDFRNACLLSLWVLQNIIAFGF